MRAVWKALRAVYDFICGDAIILIMTIGAFVVAGLLVSALHAPDILVVLLFVGAVVCGLVVTLSRERNATGK